MENEAFLDRLYKFARDNASKVKAVSRGNDPEEGTRVFYFLVGRTIYDSEFEQALMDLDLKLSRKYRDQFSSFSLSQFPIEPTADELRNYPFVGEIIWHPEQPANA